MQDDLEINDITKNINSNLTQNQCENTIQKGIIYKCFCTINNKIYIGVTRFDLNKRINEHIKLSRKKLPRYIFHKAIKKYGIENFKFEVIDTYENINSRDEKEILYIKQYNSFYVTGHGYNMTIGGDGSRGHKLSDESIQKIRDARKNQIFSEETRKLWSMNRKGKKLNHGLKVSKAILEKGSHKKSEETKNKIRMSLTGRKNTIEYKQKISMLFKGKINIKYIPDQHKNIILDLYINKKMGLHSLCKHLKTIGIYIGHCAVKRLLIQQGIYKQNKII